MNIRRKTTAGYVLVALMASIGGIVGLVGTKRMLGYVEGGESQLRSTIANANGVSSLSKRAEAQVMLYLTLNDKSYKTGFFETTTALEEKISLLDREERSPQGRQLVDLMKKDVARIVPLGSTLIELHDEQVERTGQFKPAHHQALIRRFHDVTRGVRVAGIRLAEFKTDFLNRQEAITASTQLSSYATRAEGHLVLYLLLGDDVDKSKFFSRVESIESCITILDKRLKARDERETLARIRVAASDLVPAGKALTEAYHDDVRNWGHFIPNAHKDLFTRLRSLTGTIRDGGIFLAELSIDAETRPRRLALENASRMQKTILTVMVSSILMALILGYVISRNIADPVEQLTRATKLITGGNYETELDIETKDEIGVLAKSFNEMTANLTKTRSDLVKSNEQLSEEIVYRKGVEQQIQASLQDKEVMLREIHHRVKNNLQIICSLLSIQAVYVEDDAQLKSLGELQNRVRSMALVHEALYQSESLARISAREYVLALAEHLWDFYGSVCGSIVMNTDLEDITLGIDTAVPLGFLITELVSNSLKHAFPNGRGGEVRISLHALGQGEFELVVKDDGVGMHKDIDWDELESMGLELVDAFVGQLQGRLVVNSNGGTEFRVRFNEIQSHVLPQTQADTASVQTVKTREGSAV